MGVLSGKRKGNVVMAIRASEAIEHQSDQLEGYAQETARTVEKISEQYEISKEFALSVVQTAVENMKIDVEHNRNYQIELIADALKDIADAIKSVAGDL